MFKQNKLSSPSIFALFLNPDYSKKKPCAAAQDLSPIYNKLVF